MNPVSTSATRGSIESVSSDIVIPQPEYTEKEQAQRARIRREASNAATQRDQKYMELDDMDYKTWYKKSKQACQAYIRPKTNQEDVKVVTGTTREKGNTVVASLLSYNLECDVMAFDDHNSENRELGQVMEKMVRKSRELEFPQYEKKRPLIYAEVVNQGNVFVRESYDEYQIPEKELEDIKNSDGVQIDQIKWKKKLGKVYGQCNSTVLTGLEVFPGNIRQYFMELQPYVLVRKVVSFAEAQSMFGNWERFGNVSPHLRISTELEHDLDYDDFQMISSELGMVEVLEYFNKWNNEYQILLNGVAMLPEGFPLSAFLGVCEYPIAKGDGEAISPNFFYSRGIGAKTKMDQAIIDEMYKMMIVKTRRSYKPPLANRSGANLSPTIYMPGKIFKNIDPEKIQPIGDTGGVTPAEFNMIEFVKGVIDNKSVTPVLEGQAPGKQATARQLIMQKEQSMMKLGNIMLGVLNLEQRMAWLRIYNILRNWTKPVDSKVEMLRDGTKKMIDIYRTISVNGAVENGREGENIIDFTEDMPLPEQVMAEEDLLTEVKGKTVRKFYLNPKELKSLKYLWEVKATPTEKNSDELKATMFEEFLQKVLTVFAPAGKMPNIDYLAERFAQVNNEDPDQIWQQAAPQGQLGMQGAVQGAMQGQGQVANQMQPQAQNKPSLNTLMQG